MEFPVLLTGRHAVLYEMLNDYNKRIFRVHNIEDLLKLKEEMDKMVDQEIIRQYHSIDVEERFYAKEAKIAEDKIIEVVNENKEKVKMKIKADFDEDWEFSDDSKGCHLPRATRRN